MRHMKRTLVCFVMTIAMVFLPLGQAATEALHAETMVYVTKTGSKYHTRKCGNGNFYQQTLSEAKARGLTPCSKCYGSASGGGSAASGGGSGSGGSGGSGSGSSEKSGSISVSASSLTQVRGSTKKLKVKGGSGTTKWSSSNKKVASVSADGEVIAKGKGKAVITVTRGGKKATCTVRVETPKLDMTEITLEIGETEFLELKGCSHAVEWTSSDEDVCDVCEGELIPVGEGTATVTAKVHGVRFRCEVTVVDPDEDFDDNV